MLFPAVTQVVLLKVPEPLLVNVMVRPDEGCPFEPFPMVPVHVAGVPVATEPGLQDTTMA